MKRILKNPIVKILAFFLVGAAFYLLSDVVTGLINADSLEKALGTDFYRIISRIIYIFFGLAFFAAANKIIRGKHFKEIFVFGTPKTSDVLKYVLIGTLVPIMLLGLIFLLLMGMGYVKVSGLSDSMRVLGFMSIGLSVVITALFEELAFRSFVFKTLAEKYGLFAACTATSILFTLLHLSPNLSAIGYINLFLLGVAFTALNLRSKSVLPSIFAHFTWNFMHCVILSLRMYGGIYYPHVMEVSVSGPKILSGGNMGLEESVFTTVLLLIVSINSYKVLKESRKDVKSEQL